MIHHTALLYPVNAFTGNQVQHILTFYEKVNLHLKTFIQTVYLQLVGFDERLEPP